MRDTCDREFQDGGAGRCGCRVDGPAPVLGAILGSRVASLLEEIDRLPCIEKSVSQSWEAVFAIN